MKLWFNKKTKKFLVTDDNYNKPIKLFMNKVEVTFKELEKSSYNGWSDFILPKRDNVILIPNKHGKTFSKFKVMYHNIKIAKRFIDSGDLPIYTQHLYSIHFLKTEKMYWIPSKYKNKGFPIHLEDTDGFIVSIQLDDDDNDMAIFDYYMAQTIRDYVNP